MSFTVLATDKVSAAGLALLYDHADFEVVHADDSGSVEFWEALATANALMVRSATTVTAEMIAAAPELKAIGRAGAGVDNVDMDAATAAGVSVYNAPGGNTIAAAELTMALMLSLVRKVPAAERSVRDGKWDRAAFEGTQLRNKLLGLVGAGRIGGEVAIRCRGFGMSAIVYDPYLPPERAAEIGVKLVDLDTVIENADVISCHVPLTDETRGLVNGEALARMKSNAIVINASRGGVVREADLAAALHRGEIAGAALDVYESEPLAADSPLRDAPNLVLTPHLGGSTAEAQIQVAIDVAEQLVKQFADGDKSGALNAAASG